MCAALILSANACQPVEEGIDPAMLVLRGGVIYTVSADLPEAAAIAVTGKDIVFVGSDEDAEAYMANNPGIGLDAARFLVEESGAMVIGVDNLTLEAFPSELEDDYIPVHTYLLAQQGAPILELVYLEDLSNDAVYEFAFIGGSLKLRAADGAPIRPIAIPLR